jgi:hypothetical protein
MQKRHWYGNPLKTQALTGQLNILTIRQADGLFFSNPEHAFLTGQAA